MHGIGKYNLFHSAWNGKKLGVCCTITCHSCISWRHPCIETTDAEANANLGLYSQVSSYGWLLQNNTDTSIMQRPKFV